MQFPIFDIKKSFGMPAISFIGMQLYYERYKHVDDRIYKRDRRWFTTHPRQTRFIRAAKDGEFNHADAHIDYFGTRIAAPQLWVCVEKRHGGMDHVVTPVYRGSCFWPVDNEGFMLVDDANDDEGNCTADRWLFRMHQSGGVNIIETQQHAERVAEISLALTSLLDSQKAH